MWICYIDEAGCTGELPSKISDIQPILTIGGVLVDQTRLGDLTTDFLNLKMTFFPGAKLPNGNQPRNFLDWALFEVKGQPEQRTKRRRIAFHLYAEVPARWRRLFPNSGNADFRAQRESHGHSNLRLALLGPLVPDGD